MQFESRTSSLLECFAEMQLIFAFASKDSKNRMMIKREDVVITSSLRIKYVLMYN